MFENTDMEKQKKRLLDTLVLVVNNLTNPDKLVPALQSLGRKHQEIGAEEEHYPAVKKTLLGAMRQLAGAAWTDEVNSAWEEALEVINTTMLNAYTKKKKHTKKEEVKMVDNQAVKGTAEKSSKDFDLNSFLRSSIDKAGVSIMTIDRDFVITYANESTVKLVNKNVEVFQKAFPGIDWGNLIGVCIDVFHKNPAHQRKLLSDPSNLPYVTNIEIGPLTFRLNVTATFDDKGEYVGNTLEWAEVTEALKKENEASVLKSSIDGAGVAIMMVDRDLVITYANQTTVDMVSENLAEFQKAFPGVDFDNLIGACIDIFHKNPAHQRKILSDPKNLPYKADIQIGNLKFALNVTASVDAQGNYVGNTLEWKNVTAERAQEVEVARLNSMIEGLATSLMVCDTDLVITYCNPSVIQLLSKYQDKLRTLFPAFDPNNLVGVCIDDFHANPSHQRGILSNTTNSPYDTEITVGGLEFGLRATVLTDNEGNYIGNAVEWIDNNARAINRREVDKLLKGAEEGDLSVRVDVDVLEEESKPLMEGT